MTYADRTIAQIKSHGVFALARLADVANPDTLTSPGAAFLLGVRDALAERVDYGNPAVADEGDLRLLSEGDAPHEIADSAVPIYNADRWATVGDLAAWSEEVDEFGTPSDLIEATGWALYAIALRLVHALIEDARENVEDED